MKPVDVSVHGRAILEKDSLAVIGSATAPGREAILSIRPIERAGSFSNAWAGNEADGAIARELWSFEHEQEPDDVRLVQYLRNCLEQFETRVPSAAVTFRPSDWEFGNKDEWYIECEVPQSTFGLLAGDIESGRCYALTINLELNPTLSDAWCAPPSVPVTLGILVPAKASGGSALGWTTDLYWQSISDDSETPVESPTPAAEAPELLDAQPVGDTSTEVFTRIQQTVLDSIGELSRTTQRGFVFVLILIGLLALFH